MSRLPALKYRDVAACPRRRGFEYLRPGKGSHEFWINRQTGKVRWWHATPAMSNHTAGWLAID